MWEMLNDSDNNNSCATCIKKCEAFQALSAQELDLMYSSRYEAFYRAGEVIAKQGTPISQLISISSGMVKVVLETPGSNDIILTLAKAVYLVAGPGVFVDNRYHFSVLALTDVEACFLDIKYLHEFFETNGEFAKRFYKNNGERSIHLYSRLRSLNQKNMAGRISEAILYIYRHLFETPTFDLILTRQELGDFTGMTKESVSRIFKELREEGIIEEENGQLHILDMERLESIARRG